MAVEEVVSGKEAEVVKALEDEIIFGKLRPGERLTEDLLLARFPVSRHFVRQAIAQLERVGLLVRERNKTAAVRMLTTTQVRQIYDVREMVQRQAALLIPLPAPRALIDELNEIQKEYAAAAKSGSLRRVHELNDQFHLRFFSACGNPYLVATIEQYMHLSLIVRAQNLAKPDMRQMSRRHHDLMIKLLKGTDRWALAQLCVDHIQPSKEEFLQGQSG
jgi:DNA-binding GntR family transcriptional regulator